MDFVRGFQYSNVSDAALARRQEAEHVLRDAERIARLSLPCTWRGHVVTGSDAAVKLSGRRLHGGCAAEFDAFTYGAGGERKAGCADPTTTEREMRPLMESSALTRTARC